MDRGQDGSPATLVLTDGDKLDFLCAAIAGLEAGCNLVLGSEEWDEAHFREIVEWVGSPVVRIHAGKVFPLTDSLHHVSDANRTGPYPSPWIAIATGGSSGKFKLAVHTPETLTASALGCQQFLGGGPLNSFHTLPLHHISGWMTVWRAWATGGKLANLPLSPALTTSLSEWIISLVPTQLYRELNTANPTLPFHQLRTILIGGAPLNPELAALACSRKWPLMPSYGMTETAALTCGLPISDFLKGFSGYGYALPHAKLTIRDPDAQGYGSLQIHSNSLYLGYLGEPRRLSTHYEPNDLGGWDSQGSLHILGRTDSVIISGGKKISPEPIEQLLLQHPAIRDAAVIGIPDPEWGERVVAFVQWHADALPSASIRDWLKSRIPAWQVPKEIIATDTIPRTSLGKLQRNRLLTQSGTSPHPIP